MSVPVTFVTLNLGETLLLLRKRSRMTLRDVEEVTGVSISTLSRIERNQTDPTVGALQALADCYGFYLKIDIKEIEGDGLKE